MNTTAPMPFLRFFLQSWFLVSLAILLPGSMVCGWFMPETWRAATAGRIDPAVTTIAILFLNSSLNVP